MPCENFLDVLNKYYTAPNAIRRKVKVFPAQHTHTQLDITKTNFLPPPPLSTGPPSFPASHFPGFNLGNKCWLIAVSIYTCLNRAIVCVFSFVRICLTTNIVSHKHTHSRDAWHTINWVEQQTFGHVTSVGFSSDCSRKEPPPL